MFVSILGKEENKGEREREREREKAIGVGYEIRTNKQINLYVCVCVCFSFSFFFKNPETTKQDIFDFKMQVFDFVLGFRSTEEGKDVKMMLISPVWSRYDDSTLFNVPQNNYIRIDDYRRAIQVLYYLHVRV